MINQAAADSNDTGGYVLDGSGTYNVTLENSTSSGTGPICITVNGQKVNTGYFTDLQGGLHIINGAHDNTITGDSFTANSGISVASGGNGFYFNICTGNKTQPFSPGRARDGRQQYVHEHLLHQHQHRVYAPFDLQELGTTS